MASRLALALFALIQLGLMISCESSSLSSSIELLMPNVAPKEANAHLCFQKRVDDSTIYITQFEPKASKERAHHILVYGCEVPGTDQAVWECGEMQSSAKTTRGSFKKGPVCAGGAKQSIIYAWAMDAPKLVLPKDVAFKAGLGSKVNYLVMQVHYANTDSFSHGDVDNSGVILTAQNSPVKNRAGVYLMVTGGLIEPNTREYFETACEMRENVEMVPFAYRAHTHKLGVVNAGYLVKSDGASGEQAWTELGRRSPQLPQMFYPTTAASSGATIKRGDILAARCTMENTKKHTVYVGSTADDEMCNFYLMYYVKGDKLIEDDVCYTPGPPRWYFRDFKSSKNEPLQLAKVPEEASKVPADQLKEMSDQSMHNSQMSMHVNMNMNSDKSRDKQVSDSLAEEQEEYEEYLTKLKDKYYIQQFIKSIIRNKER